MKDEEYEELVEKVQDAVYEVQTALDRFEECHRDAEVALSERRAETINQLLKLGFVPDAQFDFQNGKRIIVFVGFTWGGRLIFEDVATHQEIRAEAESVLKNSASFRQIK